MKEILQCGCDCNLGPVEKNVVELMRLYTPPYEIIRVLAASIDANVPIHSVTTSGNNKNDIAEIVGGEIQFKLDDVPTENSARLMTSGAVYNALANVATTMSINIAPEKLADRVKTEDRMGYATVSTSSTAASQMTNSDTIYEVRDNIDLEGSTLSLPKGTTLYFNGGKLMNGYLLCENASIQVNGEYAVFDNVKIVNTNAFVGDGYTWMTTDSNDPENDYLALFNAVKFERTHLSSDIDLTTWENPYQSDENGIPNNINFDSLRLYGHGHRINVKVNVGDPSRQIKSVSSGGTTLYGLQLGCNLFSSGKFEDFIINDVSIIDDMSINGKGCDMGNEGRYSATIDGTYYDGMSLRSCFFHLRNYNSGSNAKQCRILVEQMNFTSNAMFLMGNNYGVDSNNDLIYNNCNINCNGYFFEELYSPWYNQPSFKKMYRDGIYTNCRFYTSKKTYLYKTDGSRSAVPSNAFVSNSGCGGKQVFNSCVFEAKYFAAPNESIQDMEFNMCVFKNCAPNYSIPSSSSYTYIEGFNGTKHDYYNCSFTFDGNQTNAHHFILGNRLGEASYFNCTIDMDNTEARFYTYENEISEGVNTSMKLDFTSINARNTFFRAEKSIGKLTVKNSLVPLSFTLKTNNVESYNVKYKDSNVSVKKRMDGYVEVAVNLSLDWVKMEPVAVLDKSFVGDLETGYGYLAINVDDEAFNNCTVKVYEFSDKMRVVGFLNGYRGSIVSTGVNYDDKSYPMKLSNTSVQDNIYDRPNTYIDKNGNVKEAKYFLVMQTKNEPMEVYKFMSVDSIERDIKLLKDKIGELSRG